MSLFPHYFTLFLICNHFLQVKSVLPMTVTDTRPPSLLSSPVYFSILLSPPVQEIRGSESGGRPPAAVVDLPQLVLAQLVFIWDFFLMKLLLSLTI